MAVHLSLTVTSGTPPERSGSQLPLRESVRLVRNSTILPSPLTDVLRPGHACGALSTERHVFARERADCSQTTIPLLQRKLVVGAVDDPLEHEADRVSERVMRMPAPEISTNRAVHQVSRKCSACEEEEHLRKKSSGTINSAGEVPDIVHEALRSPGQPLDAGTRAYFEPRFGRDFSHVRVHTGAAADRSARAVSARAYTVGDDIVFGAGGPARATNEGRRLMAHELTHVVQQRRAPADRLARQPLVEPAIEVEPEVREEAREPGVNFGRPPVNTNVPIRPPTETVPGNAPGGAPSPQTPPSPYRDEGSRTQWQRASRYKAVQKEAAALRAFLEREPRVVLDRGGSPPDFVTAGKSEIHDVSAAEAYIWPKLRGLQVEFTPRRFHVLDAIDHDVPLATTPDEDVGLYLAYFPEARTGPATPSVMSPRLPAYYKAGRGKIYQPRLPRDAAIGRVFIYMDPVTLDARFDAFIAALKRRNEAKQQKVVAATMAEAEKVALQGRKRRQGACTHKTNRHKGGNAPHNRYADHVALVKGYGPVSGEVTWTSPEGVSYSFDTYNLRDQKEVWEVKTQHEWASPLGMAAAPYMPKFLERIVDLETQRLTGLYLATRCALRFRYAFDNCPAYTGFRQAWGMLPPLEYIPFPGEKKVPCP